MMLWKFTACRIKSWSLMVGFSTLWVGPLPAVIRNRFFSSEAKLTCVEWISAVYIMRFLRHLVRLGSDSFHCLFSSWHCEHWNGMSGNDCWFICLTFKATRSQSHAALITFATDVYWSLNILENVLMVNRFVIWCLALIHNLFVPFRWD